MAKSKLFSIIASEDWNHQNVVSEVFGFDVSEIPELTYSNFSETQKYTSRLEISPKVPVVCVFWIN